MEQFQISLIEKVFESPLNPRKHFNQKKMEELVESVRVKGVLVPLLVRPNNGRFEIAAGHRRIRAAIEAGLTEIPLIVREMNDADFLEVLIIENDQHEDLEPLEQALGYQTLMKEGKYDIPAIALKISKSESYVYQRIKLLELIAEFQELLTNGKITAGHAILLARLQPDQQKELAKKESGLYEGWGTNRTVVSIRDLARHIESQIHLDLNLASFKKSDPDLVPEAGSCTTCQKRTGFVPALFPEIKKKDTCTDPSCFHKKVEAFTKQWIEKKSQDSDVPPLRLSNRYESRSPKKLPEDPEKPISPNLYREITDKKKDGCSSAREGIVVEGHDQGQVLTVCIDPECQTHHRTYSSSPEDQKWKNQQRAGEEKRKQEKSLRIRILDAILPEAGALSRNDLIFIAGQLYDELWNEYRKDILQRHALKPIKIQYGFDVVAPMKKYIEACNTVDLGRLLMEMALIRNIEPRYGSDKKKTDLLLETAKRYGVDPKKIEAEFRDQVKEKKAEKIGKKKKAPAVKQNTKRPDPFPRAKTIPRKDICKLHGPAKKKGESKAGVCRECGCTGEKPCEGGCAWTDKTKTLCTACQMAKEHLWEKQNLVTVASTRKVPMHDIYKCKKCGAMGKRFGVGAVKPDKPFTELKCPGPKKDPDVTREKKIPCLDCANDATDGKGDCFRENFYTDDDGDLICDSHKLLQPSAKKKGK